MTIVMLTKYFEKLWLEWTFLRLLHLETANILSLDVKQQPNFFEHQVKDFRDLWKQLRYFGVLVSAIKNMNFGQIADLTTLMEAVNSARGKTSMYTQFH